MKEEQIKKRSEVVYDSLSDIDFYSRYRVLTEAINLWHESVR